MLRPPICLHQFLITIIVNAGMTGVRRRSRSKRTFLSVWDEYFSAAVVLGLVGIILWILGPLFSINDKPAPADNSKGNGVVDFEKWEQSPGKPSPPPALPAKPEP